MRNESSLVYSVGDVFGMSRAIIDVYTLFLSPVFELPRQTDLDDLIDLAYVERNEEEGGGREGGRELVWFRLDSTASFLLRRRVVWISVPASVTLALRILVGGLGSFAVQSSAITPRAFAAVRSGCCSNRSATELSFGVALRQAWTKSLRSGSKDASSSG